MMDISPREDKKMVALSVAILLVPALLTVCLGVGCEPEENGCQDPNDPPGEVLQSELGRELSPDVSQEHMGDLVAGNRAFAADLYGRLAAGDSNLFFSPHSISIALAMTYGGARTESEAEMAQTLHFTLPQEDLHPAFNRLDLHLAGRGQTPVESGDPFELHIVNSIWGQTGYPFLESYLDLIMLNYGAKLRLVDFVNAYEEARLRINEWAEFHTRERIQDLIPEGGLSPDTRMVLANAVYFKAGWLSEFDPERTESGQFTLLDGSTVRVPMMTQYSMDLRYAQRDGVEVVDLPYVGEEVSMAILLPEPGRFAEVEAKLDGELLGELLASAQPAEGSFSIPRFEFEAEFKLKEVLMAMGMEAPFSTNSDFSGMDGQKGLYISEVYHKAYVGVDEEGTEAAAATAVVMDLRGAPSDPYTVVVDRPFIFAIVDNLTGAVLFLGRVLNPVS